MEREILFRGKSKETGEWLYGDLNHGLNDEVYIRYIIAGLFQKEAKITMVDKETVGQFTGKTTTNTSLVYYEVEKLFEDQIFTIGNDKIKYRVVFEDYEWIGVSNEGDDFGKYKIRLSAIKNPIYIIGNIHDCPELLK